MNSPTLQLQEFIDSGLDFEYNFEYYTSYNKIEIAINLPGYSIPNILSLLRKGEVISFLVNDGKTNNGKYDNDFIEYYNEKYDNSIYWECPYYGDRIRISTNMTDFRERLDKYINILARKDKILKIKNNIY